MSRPLVLLVTLLLLPVPAKSIVIRHDRDPAAYRALAAGHDEVCRIGGGTGTLVDPRWVLTAGHVADALPREGARVQFGEREVAVRAIHVHPRYLDGEEHRDLALLELAEPIDDIVPAALQRERIAVGQEVTFVGDGFTGTGETGSVEGERILRAAHNTVSFRPPGWLLFTFDRPPAGHELEGISGPGDSGGPALIGDEGAWRVVGVSAYNDGGKPCTYGTVEHYCSVADEIAWIDAVMSGDVGPESGPRLVRYGEADGQATASREEVQRVEVDRSEDARLWKAVASVQHSLQAATDEAFLTLFTPACRERETAASLLSMKRFMAGVREARGPIVAYHPLASEGFRIADSSFPMRSVVFHLEDGMAGYFGIAMDEQGRIDHFSLFVQESICGQGTRCAQAQPLSSWRGSD